MPALVTTGAPILPSLAFAVPFLWLSLALGRRLLRWLGVLEHNAGTEWTVIAIALGAGALQFIPFALGVMGMLRISALRVAVAALALALLPDLWAVARGAWQARAHWRRPPNWLLSCLAALLPMLVVTALLAVAPTTDPDGLGYHLTVPKRWLESESLSYLPTYPYSNTPMGVEMLFTIALAFAGDAAAKSLHLACGILGALGLYLAGRRLRGDFAGAIAAVLYLVGPVGVGWLLGCAYLEGATAFAMITSTLAWLIWFQERKSGWLRAAFALAGIAVTFKITAALFPIALMALTLAALSDPAQRQGKPLFQSLRPAWQLFPITALPVAPWLLRSAVVTGNPFFPLFARWIPSRDLSPALAKQFEEYNRYMLWASRLGASWSLEQRKLVLAAVALATILVTLQVLVRRRSHMARAVALVVAGTVLVQLGAVGLYVRYWIPSFAVLEIPLLLALPTLGAALSERRARVLLIAATAAATLAQTRQALSTVDEDFRGLVSTAFGLESQRAFLERHLPLFPLYLQANRTLPRSAKIVLSAYCGGFYLDRTTYCAEVVQDSLRFTGWDRFMADVRRLGVTHVLAPTKLATAPVATKPAPDTPSQPSGGSVSEIYRAQQNEFVGRLLNDHGRLLGTAADQGLYAIDFGPNDAR